MTCRHALTILIDETDERVRGEILGARLHASRCPRCSSAYKQEDPEVAAALRVFAKRGRKTATTLRTGVLLISITQLVFAIPWLFGKSLLPDSHVAMSHLTRDGALGLVIAALGLVTVWRPRYVHATRIMGLLVLGLQLVSGLADREEHLVSATFEVVHLPIVLIVLGLCGIASNMARRATPRTEPRPRVLHPRSPVS